jgi:hypothetical protein
MQGLNHPIRRESSTIFCTAKLAHNNALTHLIILVGKEGDYKPVLHLTMAASSTQNITNSSLAEAADCRRHSYFHLFSGET